MAMIPCKENPNYSVDCNGNVYRTCREQKSKAGNTIRKYETIKLKGSIDKYGYCVVRMMINGVKKHVKVHRLIASAFIPNPKNKPEVNHINGIKTDNRVENLEWNTRTENNRHAIDNGLLVFKKGDECKNTKIKSYDFMTIYLMHKVVGMSRGKLAKMNNVCNETINKVIRIVEKILPKEVAHGTQA